MSLLMKGVTKLSELIIDAAKNWSGKKIENLGSPDTGDDAKRHDSAPASHTAASHSDIASSGANIDDAVAKKHTIYSHPTTGTCPQTPKAHNQAASTITSDRFPVDRLPAMTDEKIWKGTGGNVEEVDMPAAGGLAIFGDGSDGNHTVTAGYTGGPITNNALTRDAFFDNLTINNGVTLDTAGFRIFVKNTLTNNGTISRKGNDGADADAAGAGPGGAGLSGASLGTSKEGGTGGIGGAPPKNAGGGGGGGGGVAVIVARVIANGSGIITVKGGDGGNGFAGPAFAGTGAKGGDGLTSIGADGGIGGIAGAGTPGAAGVVTPPVVDEGGYKAAPLAIILRSDRTLIYNGGAGGGGGAASGVENEAGGGGGGGGGFLTLIYNSATWGTEQANGGTGGAAGGTGGAGANGEAGTVLKIANA